MHLQLVGRLDPNETYAIFNIEKITNILSGNWINLELLNIIICQNQDHSHFDSPETAPYPVDPIRYQEKVLFSIPKPRQVTFRRRTFQLSDQVTLPLMPTTQESPPAAKRSRRLKRAIQLEPLQMEYSAIFKANIHRFEIADFPNSSIARVIEKMQTDQRPRIINHFQKLLTSWPSYEIMSEPATRRGAKRIKITLPPLTRLMCTSHEIFKLMGFENQIVALTVQGTSYYVLLNSSRTSEKIFTGKLAAETAMKFSVLYESENCPQLLRWHFMRYPDTFPATPITFAETALCRQNPRAAEVFLRLTLECIEEFMALPSNCLTTSLTDNYLEIKKTVEFYNSSDNSNNFSILIRLGARLQELLGFEDDTLAWTMGKKDQKYQLNIADPPESPEESSSCMNIISDILPQHFNNQHGPNPLVRERQEKWKQYVKDEEEKRLQQIQQELDKIHQEEAQPVETPVEEEEEEEGQTQTEAQPVETPVAEEEEERQTQTEAQPVETPVAEEERQTQAESAEPHVEEEEERLQQEADRVRQILLEQETTNQAEEESQREEQAEQEQSIGQQLVMKKQLLQQATSDEEGAQEYLHSLETGETTRVEEAKKTELIIQNEEQNELDTLEEQATLTAKAGNTEEAQQLVQQWKDLKIDLAARRQQRRSDEEDRLEAFRRRLEEVKTNLSKLVELRQAIELELRALKETHAREEAEEEESDRGRQQLLQDLEEEEARLETDEPTNDDDEYFIQVEINNPLPRPPASFTVANHSRKHICTAPEKFPDQCTIILKEGEPDDYVTSRGLCCVLGIIRESAPNIQSNSKCIIKRFQTLKYISLEFVDESLNTFKIESGIQPMWIKIDLSCTKYN